MRQIEMVEELKKFPTTERLMIVEAALRLIREDIQQAEHLSPARTEKKDQMAQAAGALLPDYAAGGELGWTFKKP
ncbi:hypothetical protein KKH56_00900 [bacterium]|nr:hypothetical protein [bacterium]